MAITAAITLSNSAPKAEQLITATCTITNSGSGTLYAVSVQPHCVPSGLTPQSVAVGLGAAPVGGGFTSSIAGSNGTLAVPFSVVFHAPITSYNVNAEPSSFAYDVGATVTTNDGSIVEATVATATVSYPAT